jgi:hypothetical protein
MARKRTSQRPSAMMKLGAIPELLTNKLEDPGSVLEVLVNGLAKGEALPDAWDLLHQAVARDELVAEMAFAYEETAKDKRTKLLPPGERAFLFLQAGRFAADFLGDQDGAAGYARQVLEAVPAHPEGTALLERTLTAKGDRIGLARLHAESAAGETDRGRQLALLRQAAEELRSAGAAATGFPFASSTAVVTTAA